MNFNDQFRDQPESGNEPEEFTHPDVVVIGHGIERPWDLGATRTGKWTRAQDSAC